MENNELTTAGLSHGTHLGIPPGHSLCLCLSLGSHKKKSPKQRLKCKLENADQRP